MTQLVHQAKKLHSEHLMAWKLIPGKRLVIKKLLPTPEHFLKINFDVAVRETFSMGVAGCRYS